jgi:hypothetical protein
MTLKLRVRSGQSLGAQLYIGEHGPRPALFKTPRNRDMFVKPTGGLWTSTYLGAADGSDWVRWCRDEGGFGNVEKANWWLLTADPEAHVLVIDSYADLARATAAYPLIWDRADPFYAERPKLDYEAIARDFDGVHLTDRGQWRTRLTHPLDLYGWDCESTLWLRWSFEGVQECQKESAA